MSNVVFTSEKGNIKIDDDVFASIAAITAAETAGVAGMSSNLVDGVANFLGRKSLAQGVKVQVSEENTVEVNVYIIVEYGYRIPDIALRLQERIKSAIEKMTEFKVISVNVYVQRIVFDSNEQTNTETN